MSDFLSKGFLTNNRAVGGYWGGVILGVAHMHVAIGVFAEFCPCLPILADLLQILAKYCKIFESFFQARWDFFAFSHRILKLGHRSHAPEVLF